MMVVSLVQLFTLEFGHLWMKAFCHVGTFVGLNAALIH
jgi:hypothetical protein